jgi:small-conductance mechanosensitive channel
VNLPSGWLHNALPIIWPIVWVAVATIAGVLIDRVALLRLLSGNFVRSHPWFGVGLDSLRAGVIFWFVIVGIHAAMITSPLDRNLVHVLDDVLLVLAFGSLTWVAARFAGGAIHTQARGFSQRVLSSSLLATIVQVTIVTIGILIIFQSLGVAIAPLLTALGVGGLAVALALQPTLGNLFAGVQLVASRALRPGDYISIGGFEGFVEDITWRTTSIRNLSNDVVVIPNQTIATTIFVNYRLPIPAVAIEIPFTVKAGTDLDRVEQSATQAATAALEDLGAATVGGVPPSVRFETITDGSVQAHLLFRVPESVDAGTARNETVKRLFRALAGSP